MPNYKDFLGMQNIKKCRCCQFIKHVLKYFRKVLCIKAMAEFFRNCIQIYGNQESLPYLFLHLDKSRFFRQNLLVSIRSKHFTDFISLEFI